MTHERPAGSFKFLMCASHQRGYKARQRACWPWWRGQPRQASPPLSLSALECP
jgi:hypothetical protein